MAEAPDESVRETTEPHPDWGPCDGFGPNRTCSECARINGSAETPDESVSGEGQAERIIRDLFPDPHGFSKRFVLAEIAKLRTRLEAAEQELGDLRTVRDGANTAEGLWHGALKREREKYNALLDENARLRTSTPPEPGA